MALLHACTIEDDCLIGMKSCVMDGAVIERIEDVIEDGDWRLYEVDLAEWEPGRYWANGFLNGTPAFEAP